MSAVLDINIRTVERWKAGKGEPPSLVVEEMRWLVALMPDQPRAIGLTAHLWAQGENLAAIRKACELLSVWPETVIAR
jgi:hypothetical protein